MQARPPTAGLARRLAAIAYDTLILLGMFMLISMAFVAATQGAAETPLARLLVQLAFVLAAFVFFGWFWVHGGQTLGMRTWRLRIVTDDGGPITWRHASKRYLFALVSWAALGLGFLWALFDRDRLAWHDRWSGTRLIVLPKSAKESSD